MDKSSLMFLILGILLLVFLSIVFTISFYFYIREIKKAYKNGAYDKEVEADIYKDVAKYQKHKGKHSFLDEYDKKKKRRVVNMVLSYVFTGAIIAVLITFFSMSYLDNKTNTPTFIGDKSYLVIQTESMAEKNIANKYLDDASNGKYIDQRLQRYSLVGIDKYKSYEDVNLYDIVAFKAQNTILVHRLVSKTYDSTTRTYYFSFKGDSNSGQLSDEINVTEDRLIGVFNGFYSEWLGLSVGFVQNEMGTITLCMVAICVIAYDIMLENVDYIYKKKYDEILNLKREEYVKY